MVLVFENKVLVKTIPQTQYYIDNLWFESFGWESRYLASLPNDFAKQQYMVELSVHCVCSSNKLCDWSWR